LPANVKNSIDQFVAGLCELEADYVTRDRVSEYMADHPIDQDSLRRFIRYRDDRYTRNLVFRDPLFEVMLICWQPGQQTPIHTHNGQLGWMTVERGGVTVTEYRHVSCNAADNQNVVGIDCLGGASELHLDRLDQILAEEGGPVATVDKVQTIHQLGCPADTAEPAVSLHVYSLPFESCITFDLEAGQCGRRTLFWDSEYGDPVPASAR